MSFLDKILDFLSRWMIEKHRHEETMLKLQVDGRLNTDNLICSLKRIESTTSEDSSHSSKAKVFIAHSAKNEVNIEKWEELKDALESMNYSVFADRDSMTENDITFCINHMNGSAIIIVLVGDCEPFKNKTGVFCDEMKHLGENTWPKDKLIYICSYGIEDPLDLVVTEIKEKEDKQYLVKLKKHAKNHYFNYNNMRRLASKIDSSYNKARKEGNI